MTVLILAQTATYDVHSLSVEGDDDGDDDGVRVSAEFISDSRATGCLLVFEGPSTSSPDIFRALHRPQLEQGYTVVLPLSTYTVYGYDFEEDELPNSMPAVVLDRLTLTHSTRPGKPKVNSSSDHEMIGPAGHTPHYSHISTESALLCSHKDVI